MNWRGLFIAVFVLLPLSVAHAHKPSDSYLSFTVDKARVAGHWDIALRDLDYAIGLDANNDGAITWGELRVREAEITAYILPRLQVRADNKPCTNRVSQLLVDRHSDGAYAVLRMNVLCPSDIKILSLDYHLFFDLDPTHRGLLKLTAEGQTRSAVFGPAQATQRFELAVTTPWRQFLDFMREGVWHILIGFDHILFLLSLLLPAVLRRVDGRWQAVSHFRPALWNVLKIVTAFTLAHSITLSLAALSIVQLPSRFVETTIAASIVLAALNNIFPLVQTRLWLVAFGFGLIHGFGFASVLIDLDLPKQSLLLSLVGFNVGVEIGQLGIVSMFLPLAYALRHTWIYQRVTLVSGSLLIVAIACVWLVERAFNLTLFTF